MTTAMPRRVENGPTVVVRTLAVCADGFGLAPGISEGISRLARAQRITAVGCITNTPHWQAGASLLKDLPPTVEIGLQLNFTEGKPLSGRLGREWPQLPGPLRLTLQAHLGLLPLARVRNEVHAQLAAFNHALGRPPAFIAGHHHAHRLPGLRRIILDMVEHVQPLPAVRNTGRMVGASAVLRRTMIERMGGQVLEAELRQRVIAHNPVLLGTYDFIEPNYQSLVRRWLAALPAQGGLLFCHPGGHRDGDPPDRIAAARERELAYLGSVEFDADLSAANVALGPVWRVAVGSSRR